MPNAAEATRVIGPFHLFKYFEILICNSSGLLLAEERLCEIQNFALRFQRQLQSIEDGFTVHHNDEEYDFCISAFVDRSLAGQNILCHFMGTFMYCDVYAKKNKRTNLGMIRRCQQLCLA